jgi:COMPASS component SWD1
LASSTRSGLLHFWGKNYKENWSSFAPDFLEIEENEFYIEKEDEFDIV